jgi:hypothetical protein
VRLDGYSLSVYLCRYLLGYVFDYPLEGKGCLVALLQVERSQVLLVSPPTWVPAGT